MYIRSVGGGIVALVVVCGGLWWRSYSKDLKDTECLTEAHEIVAKCDTYRTHGEYLLRICDEAHQEAFEDSYHLSTSRRRGNSFNHDQYVVELLGLMLEHAERDGRADDVASLKKVAQAYFDTAKKPR